MEIVDDKEVTISVVIPTYKPREYLADCLNSIGEQSIEKCKIQVIIVLNGCNEPWFSTIRNWVRAAGLKDYTTIIQVEQGGVSNARNIGLNNSKGIFIAFIDDDDYISPSYFEELIACSSSTCVGLSDVVYFLDGNDDMSFNNRQHKLFVKYRAVEKISLLNVRSYFNGPCMKVLHKDIIGACRFDVKFKNGEDSLFMTLISDKIKQVRFASSDAVYYRRLRPNSASTSKRSFNEKLKNMLRIYQQTTMYWFKHPFKYNFLFMLSRYAACVKGLICD